MRIAMGNGFYTSLAVCGMELRSKAGGRPQPASPESSKGVNDQSEELVKPDGFGKMSVESRGAGAVFVFGSSETR